MKTLPYWDIIFCFHRSVFCVLVKCTVLKNTVLNLFLSMPCYFQACQIQFTSKFIKWKHCCNGISYFAFIKLSLMYISKELTLKNIALNLFLSTILVFKPVQDINELQKLAYQLKKLCSMLNLIFNFHQSMFLAHFKWTDD
jgi:hypothetical protein